MANHKYYNWFRMIKTTDKAPEIKSSAKIQQQHKRFTNAGRPQRESNPTHNYLAISPADVNET